jgi:hypothetical protein
MTWTERQTLYFLLCTKHLIPSIGIRSNQSLGLATTDTCWNDHSTITGAAAGLPPLTDLTTFVWDGTSVMTGKRNGVAAKRNRIHPTLVSFHYICHKLALANSDSDYVLKGIKCTVENIASAWKYFAS